ncbi:MAG: HEAT repeat domain-containing protein [Thermodesulfobacteriota bacterium]
MSPLSFSSPERSVDATAVPSDTEYGTPETFSSEAILKQAKMDLKHPDPKVRTLAIKYYLEKSFPSIPMSVLQEVLSDRDPEVRAHALRSFVRFRSPIAPSFLKRYLKDSDPQVRIAALRGMFQYQKKIDLNFFLPFLSDESSWVRRKVATLLGWGQMEGALPILMELSRDRDSMVRKAALFSLVTLYPDESENRLIEAMTDSDPGLRKWVRMTLEKIADRSWKRRTASLTNRG